MPPRAPRIPPAFALLLLASLAPPSLGTGCAGQKTDVRPTPRPAAREAPPAERTLGSDDARSDDRPAPVAAPPVDPYDLVADREARTADAKNRLGATTPTATVSDVFLLVGAHEWRGHAFERSVALVQNAMTAFLNGRFGKKPERAITVYLFPNGATYEAFCKRTYEAPCIAHFGFYEPGKRFMVMNAGLGLGTLTHELVHPLVEADFPRAPTWLNEGIASVFEQPVIPRTGEIHGAKNWRHPRLLRALEGAERPTTRLDALFGMADTTFRGDGEDLHYAMARYVCQWLDQRGKLWAFYQRWRDAVEDDPTGEKSFAVVLGQTPAEAHATWAKWVRAL